MDHQFALIAGAGLAIMIAASVFARRTGIAAPLLLVGLGIAASYLPGAPAVHVEPELILAGVLPPLLYATAVNLPVIDVRRNLGLITWLSVVLVVVSALVIGAVVHWVFPSISFALATALGAVVAPTDAVAATAIGRRVGLPPRLMAVLEGESLVNDASALVVLRTAVAAIAVAGEFSLGHAVVDFGWAVVAAAGIGLVIGLLTVRLRQRLDDPVLNTTISFAVPFLAYFPAEEVDASGVLAVVVAGLVTGTLGSRRFSARDRQTQAVTWTTINFILESAVFLAMGYQLPGLVDDARNETTAGEMAGLVAIVVGLLIVLRFLSLAWPAVSDVLARGTERGDLLRDRLDQFEEKLDAMTPADEREETRLSWARHRLARGRADVAFEEREPITARGVVIIAWAGMRGVVTVAAVQTIPAGTPHRATVVLAAFLVALITLVLFGLTLPAVIGRMGFRLESAEEKHDSVQALLRQIGESAIDTVGPVEEQTIDGEPIDPQLAAAMKERVLPRVLAGLREARGARPDTIEQTMIIQRRYLDAMRDSLATERSIGAYSSATYRQVEALLDSVEQRAGTS
ncbi:MAG TPA: sodium:proton antiporter [Nocardioides sp.]|uniref:cation:proton antiporter n=1 Tax=uncultured Nocardioides sp. TaxID=198441 RepID=UPI002615D712|nr:sodium:proton antiporter [uncultured Nocardioides sp.]HRD61158.1 sodium:proton antiporter [Nocardioides sp.]HRI95434.1 sodium:proton antiporter [Nocardioides sp.]